MHDPERRTLSRAAVILLAVSVLRWGVETRGGSAGDGISGDGISGGDVLARHRAETASAAADEARRTRPLEEGERIDPNAAVVVELDRLPGVGPATAAAIASARDTGLVFRRPDDLLAVRGIGPATLERMRSRLHLPQARGPGPFPPSPRAGAAPGSVGMARGGSRRAAPQTVDAVDVNRADVEELQRLPGVGPALARRIVEERRRRPFASVADLERVRGIGPATVERLRSMAVAGPRR